MDREALKRDQEIYDRMTDDTREVTTLADVQRWVEEIRDYPYPHVQHPAEDALHRAVLRAIANGTAIGSAGMAALALTTWELEFSRWYD